MGEGRGEGGEPCWQPFGPIGKKEAVYFRRNDQPHNVATAKNGKKTLFNFVGRPKIREPATSGGKKHDFWEGHANNTANRSWTIARLRASTP